MSRAQEQEGVFAIPEATGPELQEAIDYAAKFYMGISADEFFKHWQAHELSEENPQVANVLYIIRFLGFGDRLAKL
jgi:hypothetical protein